MSRVSLVAYLSGDFDQALRLLGSIEATTPEELYEAIVIDDSTDARVHELMNEIEGDVKIIRHSSPVGIAASLNEGLAEVSEDVVVFATDEVTFQADWLLPMVEALFSDPYFVGAQPKFFTSGGKVVDAGSFVTREGSLEIYGADTKFPETPQLLCRRTVDAISAPMFMAKTQAVRVIGGFDTEFKSQKHVFADATCRMSVAGGLLNFEPKSFCALSIAEKDNTVDSRNFADRWAPEFPDAPAARDVAAGRVDHWMFRPETHKGEPAGGSRRILVLDPWSPTADRDTGHKRLGQIIKAMRDVGHSVSYYALHAYDRKRYAAMLSDLGIPLFGSDPAERPYEAEHHDYRDVVGPPLDLMLQNQHFDVVYMSYYSIAMKILPMLKEFAPNADWIVDSVDVHFVREGRLAEATGDETLARQAAATKLEELHTYEQAHRVLCVSEIDADVLRSELPNQEFKIVPVVYEDIEMYDGYESRDSIVFVASALNSVNVDGVKWWRDEVGPRLTKLLPGVPLTVVGYDPHGSFKELESPHVTAVGEVPDVLPYLRTARLSVNPLRAGAGVKGKVIEAMMAGVPVVGTSVAAEGIGLENGVNALIADDADDFAQAVVRAYQDQELWETMRAQGRLLAETKFSIATLETAVESALTPIERKAVAPRHMRRKTKVRH